MYLSQRSMRSTGGFVKLMAIIHVVKESSINGLKVQVTLYRGKNMEMSSMWFKINKVFLISTFATEPTGILTVYFPYPVDNVGYVAVKETFL